MSFLKYEPKTPLTLRLKILNQGMAIGIHINIINVKARADRFGKRFKEFLRGIMPKSLRETTDIMKEKDKVNRT